MLLLFLLQLVILGVMVFRGGRLLCDLTSWLSGSEAGTAQRIVDLVARDGTNALSASRTLVAETWLGSLLGSWAAGADRDELDELLSQWRGELRSKVYLLSGIARLASVATLMSAVIEMSWGLMGGSGLVALQAGLPQQLAFRDVLTSLAIGFVTLAIFMWVRGLSREMATRGLRSLAAVVHTLDGLRRDSPV